MERSRGWRAEKWEIQSRVNTVFTLLLMLIYK
jgi:hypothetical protein